MKRKMACVCGYNTTNQIARHQKTCKKFAIQTLETRCNDALQKCSTLETDNERLCTDNEQLRNEITELKTRLDECRNSRPNVQNNVTINIVPYGREEPLTNAQVRSILSSIPSESVPRYIQMKHFRRPEHSNIRITNKRGRTLQIVEEDSNKRLRWVDKDRKTMLSAITDSSLEELIDRFDAEKYKIWNNWFETSGLKDEGYDKTDAFKEIMSKVENMITSQSPKNVLVKA
jgi:regulator of replication initiation timing